MSNNKYWTCECVTHFVNKDKVELTKLIKTLDESPASTEQEINEAREKGWIR